MSAAAALPRADRPLLALGLRALAMVTLATMFMLIKFAGNSGIATTEVMFWRQAISVPLILGWLATRGQLSLLRTPQIGKHARRALVGTLGLFCNVSAAMLLPLPEATTLGFTTPLFAVIIAAVLLRERVGPWRWTAVLVGFAGVLIVTQPGQHHGPVSTLGLAAGLGAGLVVSIVSFQIRELSRIDSPISCVFWFATCGALLASVTLPFTATSHSAAQWALIVGIGVTGTFAQVLLTTALRFGPVATVVVMDYTALIWATLYGWLFFDHLPPTATWLGAPAIVAAGLMITWREHRLTKAVPPATALEDD